jgi:hypothetical protein
MKLWIFGQSMSMHHGLQEQQGWPWLLSKLTGCEYINYAQPGADNFFIYHSFLENYKKIARDDLVIIGWSHPSRKSFVFNPDNPHHVRVAEKGLIYQTETKTLFRSYNPDPGKWQEMKPKKRDIEFYDNWFNNYYSDYEQRCNFQSYLDSVSSRVVSHYLPFYFSKESVDHIDQQNDNFMLEFIIKNKVEISKTDQHMNALGHQLWADHLIAQIKLL